MNWLLLLAVGGLMHAARSFSTGDELGSSGISLALGYLLVSGYFAGAIAQRARLPKLTGYQLFGMIVGPAALGMLSEPMLARLELVNGMAVAMIALTAGTELEIARIRPLAKSVGAIAAIAIVGTALLLTLTLWLARSLLPFLAEMSGPSALTVAALLAVVMVAQSPAVVVALGDELRADGPVARTALAVVVLGDLLVIFLFAVMSTVAKAQFGGSVSLGETVASLAWEIGGSLIAGLFVGLVLMLYLRKVRAGTPLFVLAITFIIAEVGGRLGFDPLLLALAAGALVRNTSAEADALHSDLQISALPVYVLFFCLAGAALKLDALRVVWLPASLIVLVRAAGLLLGSRLAANLVQASPAVRRYAGFGLLPQAGLALALALLFGRTFPEFGDQAGTLILSVVALNQLLTPIAYRSALERSGEAGAEPRRSDVSGPVPTFQR